jgi:hypothetical protein
MSLARRLLYVWLFVCLAYALAWSVYPSVEASWWIWYDHFPSAYRVETSGRVLVVQAPWRVLSFPGDRILDMVPQGWYVGNPPPLSAMLWVRMGGVGMWPVAEEQIQSSFALLAFTGIFWSVVEAFRTRTARFISKVGLYRRRAA